MNDKKLALNKEEHIKIEYNNNNQSVVYSPQINLDFPARMSSQLFNYGQYRWRMSVRSFRLLMMVTQTLAMEKNQSLPLFPEYIYPLKKVFAYMGITLNGKRYDLLSNDTKELMSTVIEVKDTSKKGKFRWIGKTLISLCEIDSETSTLKIKINEDSRDYLVGMKRWSEIEPRIYLNLTTEYQNWFYAYFKKEMYLAENTTKPIKMIVDIETLKEMLYLTEHKTYNQLPNANEKFFHKVLGIQKPKDWKYNKEDEKLNTPWDFYKERNKETGTLYSITTLTDINACAYPIKEGKSYTKICFIINYKKSYLTQKRKKIEFQQKKNEIIDMGVPTKRTKRTSKNQPQTMEDLFKSTMTLNSMQNPIYDETLPEASKIVIPHETVDNIIHSHNMMHPESPISKEQYIKDLGYHINEKGEIVKDFLKPFNIKRED